MWKRLRLVIAATAVTGVGLVAVPPMAQAAPLAATVAGHTGSKTSTALSCSVGALTDVVDGTTRVSGSGWVTCSPIPVTRNLVITVTLFRNGVRTKAAMKQCASGVSSCYTGVEIADTWAGSQRWQVHVLVQDWYTATKWGNNLYH